VVSSPFFLVLAVTGLTQVSSKSLKKAKLSEGGFWPRDEKKKYLLCEGNPTIVITKSEEYIRQLSLPTCPTLNREKRAHAFHRETRRLFTV